MSAESDSKSAFCIHLGARAALLFALVLTVLALSAPLTYVRGSTWTTDAPMPTALNFLGTDSHSNTLSMITTYYWDNGWVEHATWTPAILGRDLVIDIDAWNWEPEFSALNVKYDNVIAYGDIDPIIGEGIVDDFDDGIIDAIWSVNAAEGTAVYESNGVLNIDVPAGTTPGGWNQVGGVVTKDFVIHGDFEIQVDFTVNPEYHVTPNCNAKLLLTDQSGNSVEMSLRSGYYLSKELPSGGPWTAIRWTPTDHLNGKLRITRTEVAEVTMDDIRYDVILNGRVVAPGPLQLQYLDMESASAYCGLETCTFTVTLWGTAGPSSLDPEVKFVRYVWRIFDSGDSFILRIHVSWDPANGWVGAYDYPNQPGSWTMVGYTVSPDGHTLTATVDKSVIEGTTAAPDHWHASAWQSVNLARSNGKGLAQNSQGPPTYLEDTTDTAPWPS